MSVPNRRLSSIQELKDYCLRALGRPVINVEVEDTQAYERIYDAFQFYGEHHFDGVQEIWHKVTFTAADEARQRISLPLDLIAVLDLYDPGTRGSGASADEFDRVNYLIANSDLFYFSQAGGGMQRDLKNYEITMSYIRLLQIYFTAVRDYTFNKAAHELIVPGALIKEGRYIMIRAFRLLDPEVYTDVLNDYWVKRYATALIKRQWGMNIKKYDGVQMIGGITLNGQKIWDEADAEILRLEEEFSKKFTLPLGPIWG